MDGKETGEKLDEQGEINAYQAFILRDHKIHRMGLF